MPSCSAFLDGFPCSVFLFGLKLITIIMDSYKFQGQMKVCRVLICKLEQCLVLFWSVSEYWLKLQVAGGRGMVTPSVGWGRRSWAQGQPRLDSKRFPPRHLPAREELSFMTFCPSPAPQTCLVIFVLWYGSMQHILWLAWFCFVFVLVGVSVWLGFIP